MNVLSWLIADLILDAPFAAVGFTVWRRRRKHHALRARVGAYGHLSGAAR